jgi:hypothetical protein
MKKLFLLLIITISFSYVSINRVYGQCSGIALGNYLGQPPQLNTYEQVMAGATSTDYINLQYTLPYNTNCAGWSLRVKANGNFTNGSSSIAPQYVALRFNRVTGGPAATAIGISSNPVALSTTNVNLINKSNAPLQAPPNYYFEHKFDLVVQGGTHLMAGSGNYTASLTIGLYDQNDQLVTSTNIQATITVNFSNTCSGATLNSYGGATYNFSTYAQQMAGRTVTDAMTVQYNPNNATCRGWSLKVRANGNFSNGSNSVPPQYISLRFNRVNSGSPSASAIGVSTNPVPLSTTDITLINPSNASFTAYTSTDHKFDMIIQGGNHLLLPTGGTYSCTLTFSLYNQDNVLVSSSNVVASFMVTANNNNSYSLSLLSPNVSLQFNTIADYTNGVSVAKSKGLKVTGYSPYQVIVKTTAGNLVSGASHTIPVSALSLETTKATVSVPAINCYPINLSANDQVIITNPMTSYLYQVVEYNLRYYTQARDNRFSIPGGTYSTNIIFVVLPQ